MGAITPGSGATIKSGTAEGQLIETIAFIKSQEQLASRNPKGSNAVQMSFNLGTLQASLSFTMPAQPGINTLGQPITTADIYLQNTGFIPGTGGTFVSTTPEAYLLEVATYIQMQEQLANKNPEGVSNVSSVFDADELTFSGNATIPIEVALTSDGSIQVAADEYLRD